MKLHPFTGSVVVLLTLSLVLSSCDRDARGEGQTDQVSGTLRIYSSLPLQGDSRPQSEDVVRAMKLALEQHHGKAGNFEIDYVSLDDAVPALGVWEPGKIESNARRAASDPHTIAYLGEFNSGASAISIPILNEAGILQVSPSNTYVGLTRSEGHPEPGEPDRYYPSGERTYGRVIPADHVQAAALVTYMKQQSCGNVFIVNDGETYGAGIASEVERTARHEDVAVLANFAFDVAATRFRALAARVKRASSDCFFFGGITMNRALEVTRDVAAAVPGIKMFYPDGCAEAFFTERIPEGLQRRVFITNPTLDQDAYPPSAQDFFDTFSTLYGKDPEPYAMYGYEAMNVVLDSIERAGSEVTATSEGRQAVVDAFFDTKDRQSVLGTYDIDAFGDTTLSDYGAYAVARGKLVFKDVLHAVVAPPTDTPQIDESVTRALTSPLEGTWRGGKVTLANLTSELTEEDARFVLNENGASEYMVTSLRLSGDRWQVSVSADGGPDLPAQAGLFSIKGNLIHMAEPAGAKYVYRYSLDGDTLRIHLVDSDAPPGDDIFQYAHYGQPFVKVE